MKYNPPSFSRREFLKLASFLPYFSIKPGSVGKQSHNEAPNLPNILIFVFDTLSAEHISLYGYRRDTMPNLAQFAKRAAVYNRHYSAGSFTSPGTASLLTGTYPWTNRTFHLFGDVAEQRASDNIFRAFGGQGYTRTGFSQNPLANYLLVQFMEDLEALRLPKEAALLEYEFSDDLFLNDYRAASIVERAFLRPPQDQPISFFSNFIAQSFEDRAKRGIQSANKSEYPQGVVEHHELSYLLKDSIDWMGDTIRSLPSPYLSYFHLWPPHDPYRPSAAFIDRFQDGWKPAEKPEHFFSDGLSQGKLNGHRQRYDEYVAFVDSEIGRLLDGLERDGVLDSSYVIFTSDHGELFERGIWKHFNPALYNGVIRVPLLISAPGQRERRDIFSNTSSVDLLPTLAHLAGLPAPAWSEGRVLPPFAPANQDRSVFAFDAKKTPKFGPIRQSTTALFRNNYKLIYYQGYDGFDGVSELFGLENDPDELVDLSSSKKSVAEEMLQEILAKHAEVNAPYKK